jgi:phosphoribosyl 1,2-cyclic phosphate phosphodiesterase
VSATAETAGVRVTVLGCGGSAGVPLIGGADGAGDWGACDPQESRNRRTRTSIVIEQNNQRLLVDTSPDLRTQLLACSIKGVDAVLYTHAHADHVTGIDEVRILNRIAGRPLGAYATEKVLAELATRFEYVFRPWKPPGFYRPVLEPHPVAPGETVEIAGMAVRLFLQEHKVTTTLGLRVGSFGYSTDVVELNDAAFETLSGIDTWLVGCYQRTSHSTHASLTRVLEWANRLGARRTILTHMGNDMDWAWMEANLPPGVEAARDGMVIEVGGAV